MSSQGAGARVAATARRADALAKVSTSAPGEVHPVLADVRDREVLRHVVTAVESGRSTLRS